MNEYQRREDTSRPPTVLYAGDESGCAVDFRMEIGRASTPGPPFMVVQVADGAEAFEWLTKNVDLNEVVVVLDLSLPVLETYGFMKGIRAEERLAALPVVVISPRANDPRIGKLGVSALVERPVELRTLVDAVRGLLSGA